MQADIANQDSQATPDCREAYEPPRLQAHGSVARLTKMPKPGGGTDGVPGTHSFQSDRDAKRSLQPVDVQVVLDRLLRLPLSTWTYRVGDPSVRHLGPMAQDFAAAFELGSSDTVIDAVDANGVLVAAVQALHKQLGARDARINQLESVLADLTERLTAVEISRAGVSPARV